MMIIRLAILGLLSLPLDASAQTSLTAEQRAEVEKMISEARSEVRREVLVDLCKELGESSSSITFCAQPERPIADLKDVSPPLPRDNEKVSKPSSISYNANGFFGTTPPPLLSGDVDRGGNKLRFELSASDKNSRAALQLSRTASGTENAEGTTRSFNSMSITASAPTNKGGDSTNFVTLDGFANAFELSFRASKLLVTGIRKPRSPDGTPTKQMTDTYKDAGLDPEVQYDLGKVKDQLAKDRKLYLYPNFEALYWAPSARRSTYGISAKIGSEDFNFIKKGVLSTGSQHEIPWSIGLFGGVVPSNKTDVYFGAGLSYARAFKAEKSRTICPLTSATVLECVTGNYGAPSEREQLLGSVEVRKAFGKFGAALKLTHDFRSHDSEADAPIYLARSIPGGFSSGLRLGWTNTDQFSVGVFIGSEFQFDQSD